MMKTLTRFVMLCGTALISGCTTPRDHVLYDDTQGGDLRSARIEVPQLVMVRRVDGQPVQADRLLPYAHTRILKLRPGKHTLEAYYEIIYEADNGDYTRFSSERNVLHVELAAHSTYRLTYSDPWEQTTREHPARSEVLIGIETISPCESVSDEPSVADAPEDDPHTSGTIDSAKLGDLKSAWREANADERVAFKAWIIKTGQ